MDEQITVKAVVAFRQEIANLGVPGVSLTLTADPTQGEANAEWSLDPAKPKVLTGITVNAELGALLQVGDQLDLVITKVVPEDQGDGGSA